ncbi:Transmembrane protein 104 [Portunus trituberculatus]|uniref:Transmembrane protein 104 n=1 Tax=Portunus trituberculatus TaxID=210409 RepID=A0A5B7K922_PORTR|nr:Transmembrane protein 104 [Portunus trituberculatus]
MGKTGWVTSRRLRSSSLAFPSPNMAAMGIMIAWAIVKLAQDQGKGHPPTADVTKLPQLFGVCVYSFMCHHSLPALITPVSEKKSILKVCMQGSFCCDNHIRVVVC